MNLNKLIANVALLACALVVTGCPSFLAPRFTDNRQTVTVGNTVYEKAVVRKNGDVSPGSLDKITVINSAGPEHVVAVYRGPDLIIPRLKNDERMNIVPYSSNPTYDSYYGTPANYEVRLYKLKDGKWEKVGKPTIVMVTVGTRNPLVDTWVVDEHGAVSTHSQTQIRESYYGF